ncbi:MULTISPECIES: NupC/NupG family nucleoside CNT transporter [Paenibacillus]|uniref:NupC/NupG family nucleoside CNT transporter n=1 Tax=Paenibacillus TaxID=44249 RepID=UPI00020D7970|nr:MULTISPECIES: NupC/NupG family nucleoside CNT transporter [Paenibacillus]EGL14956.1 nucleoside transporter, NupC family [Paenibacillus sp. HGF7]EPD92500.1 NupC family nucleoside transporter [Paenibacillus sp. HGH0039]MBV6713376.1 NupC/NupG family nucleoside CNT transporter [Paenibacillus chitinolyticus]
MSILWGLVGCMVILGIAYLMSDHKKKINYRTVIVGLGIQLVFGYIVLKWDTGKQILEVVSTGFTNLFHYGYEGLSFVFGSLADKTQATGNIFAIRVAMLAVFITPLIGILYRFGIMQFFMRVVGGGLGKLLKTSRAESLAAAGNIFLGLQEIPIMIKPYMKFLTRSEMFAIMVGGLASVAGGIMVAYAALGIPIAYLLSASLMSAPAGLIIAKIMIPETDRPIEAGSRELEEEDSETKDNLINIISKGASAGMRMAVQIIAMLIAFVSMVALLNGLLGWVGSWFGYGDLSLQMILGWLFAPLAFVIGVPWSEATITGSFLGQKFVMNEMIAFGSFAKEMEHLSPKTIAIVSFALCGFANIGSMGILLGSMRSLAPERSTEVGRLAFKAVIAASLANLLSGTIAGMFM